MNSKTLLKEAITSVDDSICHRLFEVKDDTRTIYEITISSHTFTDLTLAFFEDREQAECFIDVLVEQKRTYERLDVLIKKAAFLMKTYRISNEASQCEDEIEVEEEDE